LHPDHIAQYAAQQADVFHQGAFAVAFVAFVGDAGLGGQGGFWGGLFHGVLAKWGLWIGGESLGLRGRSAIRVPIGCQSRDNPVSIGLDVMLASPRETKLPIDFILMGSKLFSGNLP
jgi:hypothetical protein